MNCPICGKEVPLDLTQKVIWTSYGEEVCCASHSEEQIQMVSVLIFAPKLRTPKAEPVKE